METLDRILAQKAAPRVPEWPRYANFRKVNQNPHSEKVQRRHEEKFFNNRRKSSPRLKCPTALSRKWHCPANLYALKVQILEKVLAQNAALKVPEWPSYSIFSRSPKTRIFCKSANGGPRQIGQKLLKK